jgi:hypothetical protein
VSEWEEERKAEAVAKLKEIQAALCEMTGRTVPQDEVVQAFDTTRGTLIKNWTLMSSPDYLAGVARSFGVDEDELLDRFAAPYRLEFYRGMSTH